MITKQDKTDLLNTLKKIDVKQMTIEHENTNIQKWYRFGNYNALQIVSEIIKQFPEEAPKEIHEHERQAVQDALINFATEWKEFFHGVASPQTYIDFESWADKALAELQANRPPAADTTKQLKTLQLMNDVASGKVKPQAAALVIDGLIPGMPFHGWLAAPAEPDTTKQEEVS
jgi:hypothetical protein